MCQLRGMTSQIFEILLTALMLFLFFYSPINLSAVLSCLEFVSTLLKNEIKIWRPTLFGVLCDGKCLFNYEHPWEGITFLFLKNTPNYTQR
jgi:hypothetical protein